MEKSKIIEADILVPHVLVHVYLEILKAKLTFLRNLLYVTAVGIVFIFNLLKCFCLDKNVIKNENQVSIYMYMKHTNTFIFLCKACFATVQIS